MALTSIVLASAIGAGLGIVGLVYAFVGTPRSGLSVSRSSTSLSGRGLAQSAVPAVGLGLLVLILTRWPVASILAAVAVGFAPSVFRRTSADLVTERIEAVAVWTELLRDTLAAAAGLGEAIIATAPVAPPSIRDKVLRLADRLASGVNMTEALRAFASEVSDPSCDMVACALLLAASARAQKLADLLSALSESIREEVAMRLRVEASRASSRSSVRTVIVFSLMFVVALMVVARSYLSPLGTPVGQVVLAAVGACYAGGIAIMVRLVRPADHFRLLSTSELGQDQMLHSDGGGAQ
jgi:tight adherence protein B